jgi:hypothetical protein
MKRNSSTIIKFTTNTILPFVLLTSESNYSSTNSDVIFQKEKDLSVYIQWEDTRIVSREAEKYFNRRYVNAKDISDLSEPVLAENIGLLKIAQAFSGSQKELDPDFVEAMNELIFIEGKTNPT